MIDFTYTYMQDGASIAMLKPTGESDKITRVFAPFSVTVWITVIAATLATGVLLCVVNFVLPSNQLVYPGQLPDSEIMKQSEVQEGGVEERPTSSDTGTSVGQTGTHESSVPEYADPKQADGQPGPHSIVTGDSDVEIENKPLIPHWKSELQTSVWFVFTSYMGQGIYLLDSRTVACH